MTAQLVNLAGGVLPADTANLASTAVVRDTDGSVNVGEVKTTSITSSGKRKDSVTASAATATYSVGNETINEYDATGGAFTATLPPVASNKGMISVHVKTDASANAVTIKGSGSELINAANTDAASLASQYGVLRLYCNGAKWLKI